MLISKSSFSNSYSSQGGGSIYINEGSCIQYHICSINSTIPEDKEVFGCHSIVDTTKENYIIERCISESKGYGCCVALDSGSQLIDSTNISYANCFLCAAYVCDGPSPHLINFTSIFNNTADACSSVYHISYNQYVYRCNAIKNTVNGVRVNLGIV